MSESNRQKYPVRIANLKDTDIWLKRNSKIGIIREVNVLPEVDSNIEFYKTDADEETIVYKQEVILNDEQGRQYLPQDVFNDKLSEEKLKVKALFEKHGDIFIKDDTDIGYTTTIKHKINLSDDILVS